MTWKSGIIQKSLDSQVQGDLITEITATFENNYRLV